MPHALGYNAAANLESVLTIGDEDYPLDTFLQ
jgi:hypothetical protein